MGQYMTKMDKNITKVDKNWTKIGQNFDEIKKLIKIRQKMDKN